jgi:hypothetical protein
VLALIKTNVTTHAQNPNQWELLVSLKKKAKYETKTVREEPAIDILVRMNFSIMVTPVAKANPDHTMRHKIGRHKPVAIPEHSLNRQPAIHH